MCSVDESELLEKMRRSPDSDVTQLDDNNDDVTQQDDDNDDVTQKDDDSDYANDVTRL